MGAPVADVVEPLEGRDDLFVVGDYDDRDLVLLRHPVENPHHRQRPNDSDLLLFTAGKLDDG